MNGVALKTKSLRAIVTAIALTVAVLTAVSVPAGYLYVKVSGLGNNLEFKAHLKANRLAKYIYTHGALWQYQSVRLAELIEVPEAKDRGDQQRIIGNAEKLVISIGEAPAYPAISRVAPIVVSGETVGRIEVAATALPLVYATCLVAILSCFLGGAMYFAVRVFPMRALDRMLDALQESHLRMATQNFRFDMAINNMTQGLIMFDSTENLVVSNRGFISMYDLSPDFMTAGRSMSEVFKHRAERGHLLQDPETYRSEVMAQIRAGKRTNTTIRTPDGREIQVVQLPMANGGWVATHEDITERRQSEAKISHMALHDALTGLPNRLFFHEHMEHHLSLLARDQKFAVLCLDLDHFKNVNDTLGHPFGDNLLRQVSERLKGCLRDGDYIARLGGDEFAILQGNIGDPSEAVSLAARLIDVAQLPFDLDGHQVVIGVSIGIAIAPGDASDADTLLKNADMALYRAKADGRGGYRFFEAEMDAQLQARRVLELDLRKALAGGEFEVYYQPLVDLVNEEITGFEALVRWNHPQRGLVAPLDFIPLAEETGLIVPIGDWILRQACNEATNWPDHTTIAVNLSPAQFKSDALSQTVIGALASSGLAAERLELEITESVLLVDNDRTLATLHQLRGLGVRISMDDFGTGYSSLSYLRSFPFDKIKIDQSFVHGLGTSPDSMAIIRAVTGLGLSLGMKTTGEGVETPAELEYLREQGCTEAQGYLFGKAQPAQETLRLLASRRGKVKTKAMA